MLNVLLDAVFDSLRVLPFLLAVFIAVALIEEKVDAKKHVKALGRGAPLAAGLAGVIPQCGISVMAAKLYQEGCLTVGALFAAFISVSDEGVVLLVSEGYWVEFLVLTAIKLVLGISVGYAVDAIFKRTPVATEEGENEYHGCHHMGENETAVHKYLLHPLLHCLKTFAYVLAVNILLGVLIYAVGEDNFSSFMSGAGYFQPFVCALVGLIPNCGASVCVVQLFVHGGIGLEGLVAGLVANAGVGLALLFRNKRETLVCLAAMFILFTVAVLSGEIIMLL